MKTNKIKVSQIKINEANPRSISGDKFKKLVASILVFPEMLELRPVVVDKTNVALGGNMRTHALKHIYGLSIGAIKEILVKQKAYAEKTDGEKIKLNEYWEKWLANPLVTVVDASSLSAAQRQEFIVKDNVQFGDWDYSMLANGFDNVKLGDWGMDVWQPQSFGGFEPAQGGQQPTPQQPAGSEVDAGGDVFDTTTLPPELQGIDLTPADLPKIEGSDETAMERIIIVYPKDKLNVICSLLGMPQIDKVVYRLDEILPAEAE